MNKILMISISLAVTACLGITTTVASSRKKGLSETDYQQLEMFGKVLDKKHNYRLLSLTEAEHVKGNGPPVVIVAFAAGVAAGGVDAIWQLAANGQVNYWQVAATSSGAFFSTLTGGLAIPYIGGSASGALGGGVGVVAYNLTNSIGGGGPPATISTQMGNQSISRTCGPCHQF